MPMKLYYVRVDHPLGTFYKIGITGQTLAKRFKEGWKYVTPIKIWNFRKGWNALNQEQRILKHYVMYRYQGKDRILPQNGDTELFISDVLGFDTKNLKSM